MKETTKLDLLFFFLASVVAGLLFAAVVYGGEVDGAFNKRANAQASQGGL